MFLYIGAWWYCSISEKKKEGFNFQIQGKYPPSSGLVQLGLMRRLPASFLSHIPFRRINP